MKIFKKLAFLFSLSLANPVFAQEEKPKRIGDLFGILDNVFQYIFPLAGLICVVFIIIGGYMWMSAAGDPSRVKTAQDTLTWAIIGLVVVLLAVAIIEVIVRFIS